MVEKCSGKRFGEQGIERRLFKGYRRMEKADLSGQPLAVEVNVSRKEKSKVRGWGVLALFGKEGRMPQSLPISFTSLVLVT